jgi:hypothetical protein
MRTRLPISIALVALAIAAGADARSLFSSSAKTFKTEVVLKDANMTPKAKRGLLYFHGKVKSKKPGCERVRYVEVERDGISVSNNNADDRGRFSIPGPSSPGSYRVYAAPLEDENFTCKPDRSKPHVVE